MCRRETGGTGILGVGGEECVLTELNQLLKRTWGGRVVDLVGDPSVWDGLWTLDIEDPSVRSRGRQISLMFNNKQILYSA